MKKKIILYVISVTAGLFMAVGTASAADPNTYSIHQFSPFAGNAGFNDAEESLNGAPFTPATVTNNCYDSDCDLLVGNNDYFEWTVTLPFAVTPGGANIISAVFAVDRFDSNGNFATLSTDGVKLGSINEPTPDGAGGIGWSGIDLVDFSVLDDGSITLRVSHARGGDGDFGVRKFIFNVEFSATVVEVDVDIKPGGDPNSINLGSRGLLPVAVLTTDDFNALDIIIDNTLVIGDLQLGQAFEPIRTAEEDVDGDGDLDLSLKFRVSDLVESGSIDEDTEVLTLTCTTVDGLDCTGTDTVRIVPPKGKGKK